MNFGRADGRMYGNRASADDNWNSINYLKLQDKDFWIEYYNSNIQESSSDFINNKKPTDEDMNGSLGEIIGSPKKHLNTLLEPHLWPTSEFEMSYEVDLAIGCHDPDFSAATFSQSEEAKDYSLKAPYSASTKQHAIFNNYNGAEVAEEFTGHDMDVDGSGSNEAGFTAASSQVAEESKIVNKNSITDSNFRADSQIEDKFKNSAVISDLEGNEGSDIMFEKLQFGEISENCNRFKSKPKKFLKERKKKNSCDIEESGKSRKSRKKSFSVKSELVDNNNSSSTINTKGSSYKTTTLLINENLIKREEKRQESKRKRSRPFAKFLDEEVCWHPNPNDSDEATESVSQWAKEGLRKKRRTGSGVDGGGITSSFSEGPSRRRHKQHKPWRLEETVALVEGVEICGGGRWADIKRLGLENLNGRSPVDLKDKWRNLLKAAFVTGSNSSSSSIINNNNAIRKGDARSSIPQGLWSRIRKLSSTKSRPKKN